MKRMTLLGVVLLVLSIGVAQGRGNSSTIREITGLLNQFLDDAGRGNRAGFEKFFADDVIYTRSVGVVVTKAEILANVESLKPTAESKTTYSAEDTTVHEYGDTAVAAFRLIARTELRDGKLETSYYRNTGVFLRRNGRWQVIAWQSTKIIDVPSVK